jgi:hypothetical protein
LPARSFINRLKPDDSFYSLLLYLDQILYLKEMSENLTKLEKAIRLDSVDEFIRVAHNCLLISSKCGMFKRAKPLRLLAVLKAADTLAGAEILYRQIKDEYNKSKFLLNIKLEQIETYLQRKNAD